MQPHYTPNPAVKLQLSQIDLIAVVGPTGAGKNTMIDKSGLPYVRSDMTRMPRKHETDGVDANFRIDYDGLLRDIEAGLFVQYVVNPNGEFYGTKASSYPASGLCAMTIVATTVPLFSTLGFNKITPVYIVPPSYEEWMKRIRSHRDKDLPARLIEAKTSIETALADSGYHFMINGDMFTACELFRRIANGTANDAAEQAEARQAAFKILTGIEEAGPILD